MEEGYFNMTYANIEKQIYSIAEEYLEEISDFIDYILFKANKNRNENDIEKTSVLFGSFSTPVDGLDVQRTLRNEWN